jgi:phage-related protein
MPSDWKPMTTVGPGVAEIRIHTQLEHRVLYVAKFEETQRAPVADLALARARLKALEAARRGRKEK